MNRAPGTDAHRIPVIDLFAGPEGLAEKANAYPWIAMTEFKKTFA
jgi:hypothetical protein